MAYASEVTVSRIDCGTPASTVSAAAPCDFRRGQRIGELPQALVNLFKRVRSRGEQSLQRHAQIRFQHIALPPPRFIRIDMLRCGNRVAALMLRQIHRSIRHLNQFLRRGSMQRIRRDSEARADVLLAQQADRTQSSRAASTTAAAPAPSWFPASESRIRLRRNAPPHRSAGNSFPEFARRAASTRSPSRWP